MTEDTKSATLPPLDGLITLAFDQARAKGKSQWRRMTLAVLKNRLLQLTSGSFDERQYGVSSLRELVASIPTVLRVDGDLVELIEQEGQERTDERTRLRPDLWEAIVDFSSGRKYAWDSSTGRARDALQSDDKILPTLMREDLAGWRREFIAAQPAPHSAALTKWCDEGLGTKDLPLPLRGPWNGFFRGKVRGRLDEWFSGRGISVPHIEVRVDTAHDAPARPGESLRRLINACVEVMTDAELRELRLPPQAVLRAYEKKRLP